MATDDEVNEETWNRHRRWQREVAKRRYNALLRSTRTDSPITFFSSVSIDDWGVVTIGEWGGYLLQIQPLAYHDRLVLAPLRNPAAYHYGYDYPKGSAAVEAALHWDPQRRGEPDGYTRRIGGRRLSGEKVRIAPPGARVESMSQIAARYGLGTRRRPNG